MKIANNWKIAEYERERERERERVNGGKWLITLILLIALTFASDVSLIQAAGTSIPVSKGGTGGTSPYEALVNLLPSYAGNEGKVLGLSGGTPAWVDLPQRNASLTATAAWQFKGERYVELGYSGSWAANSYKRFYHGEGVSAGSNNLIVLKVTASNWGPAQYGEFLVVVNLTQVASLDGFTVVPLVRTGATPTAIPEFTLSGNATSFDIWVKRTSGAGLIAELLTYDEVSPNDTLLNDPPTTTAPTLAKDSSNNDITTKSSGSWVGDNYSTTEVNTGGTWIDGKPIYRQTFAPAIINLTTTYQRTSIATTSSDIETVVKLEGMTKHINGDAYATFPLPADVETGSSEFHIGIQFRSDTHTIDCTRIRVGGVDQTHAITPTIYYTKTTD
jgi:hypothetical protein